MTRTIDYAKLMISAYHGVIAEVLADVALNGLPGDHHFYISFDTQAEGVEISDWLRERYPDEMTIVLQHWFEDLDVSPDEFAVTLNFGDQPERMVIPFEALRGFADPSAQFGLRFEPIEGDEDDEDEDSIEDSPLSAGKSADGPATEPGDSKIVSLDQWRK